MTYLLRGTLTASQQKVMWWLSFDTWGVYSSCYTTTAYPFLPHLQQFHRPVATYVDEGRIESKILAIAATDIWNFSRRRTRDQSVVRMSLPLTCYERIRRQGLEVLLDLMPVHLRPQAGRQTSHNYVLL